MTPEPGHGPDDPRGHEQHHVPDAESERQAMWNQRYAEHDHVWSAGPNAEVERIIGSWPPGRALDLGAGEGRHAVWLAQKHWRVTAVDFSSVGLAKGEKAAMARGVRVDWVVADARSWSPPSGGGYDLVLVSYLHLPQDVLGRTTSWLAPGGALVVVGHALRNLTDGVGGPSDPALLHTLDGVRTSVTGLDVERLEEVVRPTEAGDAIDLVCVARRPVA
jgi:SAM-dependent methyltransferase